MSKTTACDYEGTGPGGTTLTNANTGGTVAVAAGCTAVSTASAAFGLFAGSFTVNATDVSSRVTTNAAGGLGFAFSFKFRIPTGFASTKRMIILQNSGAGTIMSFSYNGTTNRVQAQNSAGAATATLAFTLTLNTWYRVETVALVGTSTTGQYRANIYANEGTTPLVAAIASTTFDMGTLGLTAIRHGINSNGTATAAAIDIDSVRYDPGGVFELGPEALTALTSDLDARWKVANVVTSDVDTRWGVRGSLTSDLDARWGVRSSLASDLDARWLVRNGISSDLDARWKVANVVTSDVDTRWGVRNGISSDLDARWPVFNALTSDLDARWLVAHLITSDVDARWLVRAGLASDVDTRWLVYHQVLSDLSARWRVYSPPRDVDVTGALSQQPERAQVAAPGHIVVTLGAQNG